MIESPAVRILTQWLPGFCILSVMFYYAAFLYQHALNVPYADDVSDILLFLTELSKSNDWKHSVEVYFAQMNDHRTLSSRLVYSLAFKLEGEANFRTLTFLGNLGLPLLLLMLYLAIRERPNALLILLPAALILFQLRIYATSFWSMNAFAFIFVFVYGFASLICLRALSPLRFGAALLFATLATFTMASGQLIWLLGFFSLTHQMLVLRRANRSYSVLWLLSAAAVLSIYRIDYDSNYSIIQILGTALDSPRDVAVVFFVILGRAFTAGNAALAVSGGAVLLLVVVCSSVWRWRAHNITLELFASYIILSVLVISAAHISRLAWADSIGIVSAETSVTELAFQFAFSQRYVFFSVLLLATTAVLLVSLCEGRKALAINIVFVLLAGTYCVSSYYLSAGPLQLLLHNIVGGHNANRYWAFGDLTNETSAIVSNAEQLGIYRPAPRPLPKPNITGAAQGKTPHQVPD